MTITIGGISVPGASVRTGQQVSVSRDEARFALALADGALLVASRYSAEVVEVSCAGLYPPGLDALDRQARHTITAPSLTPGASARSWTGYLLEGPTYRDDLSDHTTSWQLRLRVSAVGTLPSLTIGGVAVTIEGRAEGATVEREPNRAYTLLQLASGAAVPQLRWSRDRYSLSGSGWTLPTGLESIDLAAGLTVVTPTWGSVACWIVDGPRWSWRETPAGPIYGWSITLQAKD